MLRPDLNGLRVQVPRNHAVYLIDQGKRRWIPNPNVYNALFRDWNGIILDIDAFEIDEGDPIPETAIIFQCSDNPKWFLLDGVYPNQTKRWIKSPEVVERYNLINSPHSWNVPVSSLRYPDGPNIEMPNVPWAY